jgi:SAM-dependent methyltransferase
MMVMAVAAGRPRDYALRCMTDQIEYWNGAAGQRWVAEQDALDAMLRPFGDAALDAARPARDEAVLDVGCGCGDTSLALAGLVGHGGRVVGLDASAPMLARARERLSGPSNVTFVEGDASAEPVERGTFDLLFSRFGVMFFPDPAVAFGRLRTRLRPGGRLAFVCWKAVADNPWAAVPFDAAASVLGRPEPQGPDAPGPFSFGNPARVHAILGAAGFGDVALRPFEDRIAFGSSDALDHVAREMARIGPVARLLVDRSEADVERAIAAIKAVLPAHVDPRGGVTLAAAVWIVTARDTA